MDVKKPRHSQCRHRSRCSHDEFRYRSLRPIDREAFRQDIIRSDFFGSLNFDRDEYTECGE